jgi:hypothetical protein
MLQPTDDHPIARAPEVPPFPIALTPHGAAKFLTAVAAAVIGSCLVAGVARYRFGIEHGPLNVIPLFDLDGESTVPSWFSVVLLLLCAALLAACAAVKHARRERYRWHWTVLACIFALMSLDEQVSIHERSIWTMQRLFQPRGILYYGWVIPAGVGLVVLGLAYLRFLVHLPRHARAMFLLSAVIYLGGAIGMEMADGAHTSRYGEGGATHAVLTSVEETFEITGLIVFVYALLSYLRTQAAGVSLIFDEPRAARSLEAQPAMATTVQRQTERPEQALSGSGVV